MFPVILKNIIHFNLFYLVMDKNTGSIKFRSQNNYNKGQIMLTNDWLLMNRLEI